MGGLAVAIDWERPVPANLIDRMLALIPHRAAGGTNRGVFGHAILGEARDLRTATSTCTVETAGDLSIVADLRLWDRSGLRSRAGGTAATVGMDDRRLLLEAYLRSGIGFLDDVNGDFAFVIWDAARRLVLACVWLLSRSNWCARPIVRLFRTAVCSPISSRRALVRLASPTSRESSGFSRRWPCGQTQRGSPSSASGTRVPTRCSFPMRVIRRMGSGSS